MLANRFTAQSAEPDSLFALSELLLNTANIRSTLKNLPVSLLNLLTTQNFEADTAGTQALLNLGLLGSTTTGAVMLAPVLKTLKSLTGLQIYATPEVSSTDQAHANTQTESNTKTVSTVQNNSASRTKVNPDKNIQKNTPQSNLSQSDAALNAFTGTQKSVLIMREIDRLHPPLNRNGSVPAQLVAQLAEDFLLTTTEATALVRALLRAGFLGLDQQDPLKQTLRQTTLGEAWSHTSHAERWLVFIAALLANAPNEIADRLHPELNIVDACAETLQTHPLLDASVHQETESFTRELELLGATVAGSFTKCPRALLRSDPKKALAQAIELFPATVAGVIIQPDFSVIAPGPLAPPQGLQLLEMAQVVTPGLATTMRITPDTLQKALARGYTPALMLDFLKSISQTPLPQPLEFMLQNLPATNSPLKPEPVQSLSESDIMRLITYKAQTNTPAPEARDTAQKLLEQLRVDPHARTRVLIEAACRARATISATITSAGGAETRLLTPVTIIKDRFRAIDIAAERELVLPLAAVTELNILSLNKASQNARG